MPLNQENQTFALFNKLSNHYGKQNWWPATTKFEMAIGAILTQSTNWNNANKALANLADNDLLSPTHLHQISRDRLSQIIRPSGYYTIKASRIKALASHVYSSYQDDFESYLRQPKEALREDLLSIKGIGKETADAIILYGAEEAMFIVDEYTKRLFSRLGHGPLNKVYDEWQDFFHSTVPKITSVYSEYHAIIVAHCKALCKKTPACHTCFLINECKTGKETLTSC